MTLFLYQILFRIQQRFNILFNYIQTKICNQFNTEIIQPQSRLTTIAYIDKITIELW